MIGPRDVDWTLDVSGEVLKVIFFIDQRHIEVVPKLLCKSETCKWGTHDKHGFLGHFEGLWYRWLLETDLLVFESWLVAAHNL